MIYAIILFWDKRPLFCSSFASIASSGYLPGNEMFQVFSFVPFYTIGPGVCSAVK